MGAQAGGHVWKRLQAHPNARHSMVGPADHNNHEDDALLRVIERPLKPQQTLVVRIYP